MRIRKRQVPLPLSSLLPVPLSDLYFNRSPTATARYFCGGYKDGDDAFASFQLPPPSSIADRLIQTDLINKKEMDDDDDNGDVDVKTCTDASSSKNVNPLGESDSTTQVVEKNEKVVSLRKRRSFVSFEEYEDEEEEEEEANGGGNKGKKKAKKSGGSLEEGSRCSRVNGRGWRCCQQTLVGYSLCEHHLGKGRVRSMNKTGGGRGGEKKAVTVTVEVKKKRVKLGMVKARSISSLLGQTSTTVEGEISALADQFTAYDK